jgi:rRNA maturation endonuclease Nob1
MEQNDEVDKDREKTSIGYIWKYCPHGCDDKLGLDYDFCPYCGAKLKMNYPWTKKEYKD